MLNPWLALSFKVFQLGIEAQSLVALRMMRLASGGAGTQAEMGRMMVEKAAAVTEAQFAAATAAVAGSKDHVIAGKALKGFRKRVRANIDASFLGWDPNDRGTSAFLSLKTTKTGSPFFDFKSRTRAVSPGINF